MEKEEKKRLKEDSRKARLALQLRSNLYKRKAKARNIQTHEKIEAERNNILNNSGHVEE